VAQRCELEAKGLREQERALVAEYEGLQSEAQKTHRALQRARNKVGEATALAEGNAMKRTRLAEAAMPFEHFVRTAREAKGEEQKLRVLEDARIGGMLMPFAEAHSSSS
jgi:hypothetical protein